MPEYREGPEAKEKFEQTMRTLFQAPSADSKQGRPSPLPAVTNAVSTSADSHLTRNKGHHSVLKDALEEKQEISIYARALLRATL
jgi:hypothetical protein